MLRSGWLRFYERREGGLAGAVAGRNRRPAVDSGPGRRWINLRGWAAKGASGAAVRKRLRKVMGAFHVRERVEVRPRKG